MINVLCVCGNGMGTSTITKINVKKYVTIIISMQI